MLADELVPETEPPKPRGRSRLIDDPVYDLHKLLDYYTSVKSIRRVAIHFGISPTTAHRYLRPYTNRPGRPRQTQAWKAKCRSEIHQWFLDNAGRRLPRSVKDIARIAGFTPSVVNRYLGQRKAAVEAYLFHLPHPNEVVVIFTDVDGQKIPSNLIAQYTIEVDRYTCDLTLSCVLSVGGQRTIKIPFAAYSEAMKGTSSTLPIIGLVRPAPSLDPRTP